MCTSGSKLQVRETQRVLVHIKRTVHPQQSAMQPPLSNRAVLKNPDFFFVKDSPRGPPTANLRQRPTATNRHQPPTAYRQPPPTTNRQPPTTNRCGCGQLRSQGALPHPITLRLIMIEGSFRIQSPH